MNSQRKMTMSLSLVMAWLLLGSIAEAFVIAPSSPSSSKAAVSGIRQKFHPTVPTIKMMMTSRRQAAQTDDGANGENENDNDVPSATATNGSSNGDTATMSSSSSSSSSIGDVAQECALDEDGASDCYDTADYVPIVEEEGEDSYLTISKVLVSKIDSLRDSFESFENDNDGGTNVIQFNEHRRRRGDMEASTVTAHNPKMEYARLIGDSEYVLVDTVRQPGMHSVSRAFLRGGPRQLLHFNPTAVNAAIVTCGGLCPGLNNVIRELVHSLYNLYNAQAVWGVTGGFNGFSCLDEFPPLLLTNAAVQNIHHEGGSALTTSRGGLDISDTLQFLQQRNITQLYVIGGDGSHRGADKIYQACKEQGLNIAVAGIGKTIDNDIDFIDRSFGFMTAVEAAQASITTARVEASCTRPNAVGVIKLMGRSAGFLAAVASLGSGDVDAVLVPEVPVVLDGPNGILPFIRQRVKEQNYAVVVVAEGAGQELLGLSDQVEQGSGNVKFNEIAEYLRDKIKEHFAAHDEVATMKYVDPSYNVRSVPANAADSLYCAQLAQNAVHGCMAGYTGFSVGLVNNRDVYIPISQITASSPRSMSPYGTTWERVLAMTGQPNTAPPREDVLSSTTTMTNTASASSSSSDVDGAVGNNETANIVFPELAEPHVM